MQKKIPMRMCIGCREMKPKRELVRIVCTKISDENNRISVDLSGKAPGRGAYICPKCECLDRAKKSRSLERAFSSKIDDEVFADLSRVIQSVSLNNNEQAGV